MVIQLSNLRPKKPKVDASNQTSNPFQIHTRPQFRTFFPSEIVQVGYAIAEHLCKSYEFAWTCIDNYENSFKDAKM
jgi:hypothetical protein